MAEMACTYHEAIQEKDKPEPYAKLLATSIVLDQCEAHLTRNQHDLMDQPILASELKTALRLSKNGSAPGIDGLPYEFYKWLEIEFGLNSDDSLNILSILESVADDVTVYGITPGTDF
ncbi:hypothetical protein C8R46DRAFT_813857, partial [Mycena filopes]